MRKHHADGGRDCRGRAEPFAQRRQVRQFAGDESAVECGGQFGLARPVMGEGKQPDHGAAGQARRPSGEQRIPGAPDLAREQLVAIDHLLLWAMQRLPNPHPALERATDAAGEAWAVSGDEKARLSGASFLGRGWFLGGEW